MFHGCEFGTLENLVRVVGGLKLLKNQVDGIFRLWDTYVNAPKRTGGRPNKNQKK